MGKLNDDTSFTGWDYPQDDIASPEPIDYNLLYLASLSIDFDTADPVTKLAWAWLVKVEQDE